MKVLCFANERSHVLYKEGTYPSHFLYGGIEIEKAGFNLVVKSGSSKHKLFKYFDHARVILKQKPDVLFIPFLSKDVFLIVLLKKLGLFKRPIVALSHRSLTSSNFFVKLFFKYYYKAFDKIYFLSPLCLNETINGGVLPSEQVLCLNWGGDLNYYNTLLQKSKSSAEGYFISTGKENRDFITLITAFANNTNLKLNIFTNYSHGGRRYNFLDAYKNKYPNINVNMIENDNNSFSVLANAIADCYCVTIPLIKSEINYGVGLSSIVEALALGKPMIVSNNPYHPIDVEKEEIGLKVDDNIESWNRAINYLKENPEIAEAMGKKARKLAEEKYNSEAGSKEIIKYLSTLKNNVA